MCSKLYFRREKLIWFLEKNFGLLAKELVFCSKIYRHFHNFGEGGWLALSLRNRVFIYKRIWACPCPCTSPVWSLRPGTELKHKILRLFSHVWYDLMPVELAHKCGRHIGACTKLPTTNPNCLTHSFNYKAKCKANCRLVLCFSSKIYPI